MGTPEVEIPYENKQFGAAQVVSLMSNPFVKIEPDEFVTQHIETLMSAGRVEISIEVYP
jgi:hypothetical protein